jgi:hypothetical protein
VNLDSKPEPMQPTWRVEQRMQTVQHKLQLEPVLPANEANEIEQPQLSIPLEYGP